MVMKTQFIKIIWSSGLWRIIPTLRLVPILPGVDSITEPRWHLKAKVRRRSQELDPTWRSWTRSSLTQNRPRTPGTRFNSSCMSTPLTPTWLRWWRGPSRWWRSALPGATSIFMRGAFMCFLRFPPESVSVCYNGGKDCIVMLHLVHAYFQVPSIETFSWYQEVLLRNNCRNISLGSSWRVSTSAKIKPSLSWTSFFPALWLPTT